MDNEIGHRIERFDEGGIVVGCRGAKGTAPITESTLSITWLDACDACPHRFQVIANTLSQRRAIVEEQAMVGPPSLVRAAWLHVPLWPIEPILDCFRWLRLRLVRDRGQVRSVDPVTLSGKGVPRQADSPHRFSCTTGVPVHIDAPRPDLPDRLRQGVPVGRILSRVGKGSDDGHVLRQPIRNPRQHVGWPDFQQDTAALLHEEIDAG